MENINGILNNFQIAKKEYNFKVLSNGLINDTYLISDETTDKYVLQKVNTAIFSDVDTLFTNLNRTLPLLKHKEYKSVYLIKAQNNKSFFKSEKNEIWRLMNFIKDSKVFNTTTNPKIAFEAGKVIGLFHKLLADVDVCQLKETLPDFHNIELRFNQFKTALSTAKPENIETAQEAINFVQANIQSFLDVDFKYLTQRVCHNDTKLNNILFSEKDESICLIDLDTIMPGKFLYDFGDAIRTIVNSAKEDEKDLTLINFDMNLFKEFIKGLSLNSDFLTDKEKELLPIGAFLMPFLHGMRALTDFLENNRYYKVSYENQNLDRSLSLFAFAKLAKDHQKEMLSDITEILG